MRSLMGAALPLARKTTVADADAHVDADADAGFDRAGILDGDIGHAIEAALHLL